jgi:hypothetical protein
MSTTITLVTKRVTAAAQIRHTVTASIRDPRNVATLNVPARRGPGGPPGPQGNPGTIGGDDPVIFDGGNF